MTSTAKRVIGTAGALVVLVLVTISVFGQSGHAGPPGGPQGAPSAAKNQGRPAAEASTSDAKVPPLASPQNQEASLPAIGVLDVAAGTYQAKVNGYGEVTAKHVLSLTAQVSGEVTRLSPHFETGAVFAKAKSWLT